MGTNGSKLEKKRAKFWRILLATALALLFEVSPLAPPVGLDNHLAQAYAEQSDWDNDGYVDLDDLALFSSKRLKKDLQEVDDWCQWLEDGYKNQNSIVYKNKKHLGELFDFIDEYFQCGLPPPPPEPEPEPEELPPPELEPEE